MLKNHRKKDYKIQLGLKFRQIYFKSEASAKRELFYEILFAGRSEIPAEMVEPPAMHGILEYVLRNPDAKDVCVELGVFDHFW